LRPLRQALVYGALWGLTVSANEALVLPFGRLHTRAELLFLAVLLVEWMFCGWLLALLTLWLEARLRRAWQLLLLVTLAPLSTAALMQLVWSLAARWGFNEVVVPLTGEAFPSWSNFAYLAWMTLFHGVVFMLVLVWVQRGQRQREWLGRAEIARRSSQALLKEAQLEALRNQVDPAFVLRVLQAVQGRYAVDAASGHDLLDQLVGFLRQAMPGLRSGHSTLGHEVDMIRRYLRLQQAVAPWAAGWRIEAPDAALAALADAAALPFPPFLLLPLLDRLAPAGAGTAAAPGGRLSLQAAGGKLTLLIEAHRDAVGASLPPALSYHLQVALHTLYGSACRVSTRPGPHGGGPGLAVLIELPQRPPAAGRALVDTTHGSVNMNKPVEADRRAADGAEATARAADPETAARAADPETAARAADPETAARAADPETAARAAGPEGVLRRVLLGLLPTLALPGEALALDAVTSQAGAFRVAFENERVRVLDFHSKPGLGVCGVGVHSHPAHLTVVLSDGKARVREAGGKTFEAINRLGDVFWSEAETHEVENVSGKAMRTLLVELKDAPARKG